MATLFDRYSGIVCTLCLKMLGDRQEAEDLLVDVFDELSRKADRYDPIRASPLTYIVTLTRSRAVDRLRTRKHRMEYSLEALSPDGPSMLAEVSDDDPARRRPGRTECQNQAGFADPGGGPAQALELSYFAGLSHAEIAEKLGKPLGTIKSYIRLGMIRLRDKLRTESSGQGGAT